MAIERMVQARDYDDDLGAASCVVPDTITIKELQWRSKHIYRDEQRDRL